MASGSSVCFAGQVSRRLRKRKVPAKLRASDDEPAQAGRKRKHANTAQRGDKQMPAQPGAHALLKRGKKAVQCGIGSLNNDLLLLVFSQLLEVRDLCAVTQVCKPWRQLVEQTPTLFSEPLTILVEDRCYDWFDPAEQAEEYLARKRVAKMDDRLLYITCDIREVEEQIKELKDIRSRNKTRHDEANPAWRHQQLAGWLGTRDMCVKSLRSREAALKAGKEAGLKGKALADLEADVQFWRDFSRTTRKKLRTEQVMCSRRDEEDNERARELDTLQHRLDVLKEGWLRAKLLAVRAPKGTAGVRKPERNYSYVYGWVDTNAYPFE